MFEFPKSQKNESGLLVERSVKFTVIGKHPALISEVNSATGCWAKIFTWVKRNPQQIIRNDLENNIYYPVKRYFSIRKKPKNVSFSDIYIFVTGHSK